MSSIIQTVLDQLGGPALEQIGKQLGTDEKTASEATTMSVATLLGALNRNAADPSGAKSLESALAKEHDGRVLDDLQGFLGKAETGPGDGILKHVLGDRRSAVETQLGKSTGIDAGSMGKLMTMLAPVVMGALGRNRKDQSLDAGGVASMLQQESGAIEQLQPQMGRMLTGLLDSDHDGDFDIGDMAKLGKGLLGRFLK